MESGAQTQAELARAWGVSRARISQMMRLAGLSTELRSWVRAHEHEGEIRERFLRRAAELPEREQLAEVQVLMARRRKRAG